MNALMHPRPPTRRAVAEVVDELVRDCFDPVSPGSMDRYTVDQRIRAMYGSIVEAFPDARFSSLWRVVEGRRAALGGLVAGTHLGPWRDVTATGRHIEVLATLMVEVVDGTVADLMIVTDTLAMAEQLGLLDPLGQKACEVPAPSVDRSSARTACGDALLRGSGQRADDSDGGHHQDQRRQGDNREVAAVQSNSVALPAAARESGGVVDTGGSGQPLG